MATPRGPKLNRSGMTAASRRPIECNHMRGVRQRRKEVWYEVLGRGCVTPLTSVNAVVDEGNRVAFGQTESYFRFWTRARKFL